ncbi:tyrosine-type recombinase/integrase [Bradyrhizobium sp. 613_E4_N2_2]|uniref:tyrosine-type recombinase/integrase n=1 Tax=Bradyrhizobium sp. 613_E4_N2_2 TaxID=3240371 RepID=UPI003F8BB0F1
MQDSFARLLSDARIRKVEVRSKAYKLADGGGLYLLVQPNGSMSWRYKFRVNGREGLLSIGQYPEVPLAAARTKHRDARAMVAEGVNPVQARRVERVEAERALVRAEAGSFAAVHDQWKEITEPRLALNTINQHRRECANFLLPEFGKRPVWEIKRPEVAMLLKRVERNAPEVARNLRTYLTQIFEHAIELGLVDANPVPSARMLRPRRKKQHAAMELENYPDFVSRMVASGHEPQTKAAMFLVILAACRKQEAAAARWSEFDLEGAAWTIPAERMKARREHWIPLSRQAVALLYRLRELSHGEFVFPHRTRANEPMASNTLNVMIDKIRLDGATVHGFRSMFSTYFNAQHASADVVERCLAHAPSNKVRAAYNRHEYQDERRDMMQQWADVLDAEIAKARNVVVVIGDAVLTPQLAA